jgi:hypothetical protein
MQPWKGKSELSRRQRLVVALGVSWICLLGAASVEAQSAPSTLDPAPTSRLLTTEEGRSIVAIAREAEWPAHGAQDCSHIVHKIYENAGFEFPYQSSFDLYDDAESFTRVKYPHTGDLIVWPGHVGIVVDPRQHSFYSLVSTGWEEQDFQGPYWKSRGIPHFYRYKVHDSGVLNAATSPPSGSNVQTPRKLKSGAEIRPPQSNSASSLLAKTDSEQKPLIYGPPVPAYLLHSAPALERPSRIVLPGGKQQPTREEVAEGISELSNAASSVLQADDPLKFQMPVVIIEQFTVERLEIKRDHGWAHLQVYSKASIRGGTIQLKPLHEKVVWELRRTQSSWEALTPQDRVYVPHDVAVKALAAQLARLTESDPAAAPLQEKVAHQESQLAQLLSVLLAGN